MADEIINTLSAQTGDLGNNAVQPNVSGNSQASVAVQSPDGNLTDREKFLLNEAFKQSQRLVSKSETRQTSQLQGMIDKFKAEYGVTLTEEQAQAMAANQAAKSMSNAQAVGQQPAQQANPRNNPIDGAYQGFLYYHGANDNPVFKQVFNIQNTLGTRLEKNDPEYQNLFNREGKYQPNEFVDAWKQACIAKIVRLQNTAPENQDKQNTNLGQMPLIGSQGKKSNTYDPARTAKSYFQEYYKGMKK